MSRKNDDDIAVYDPYVQSLRKSHMDVLRKVIHHFLYHTAEMPTCYEKLTDDEIEAFQKVVEAVNRKEKA